MPRRRDRHQWLVRGRAWHSLRGILLAAREVGSTRTATVRIYDSVQLSHSRLREFAVVAAWIATLPESASDLEGLLVDVPPEERVLPDRSTPWPWDFDSFVAALSVVNHTREAAEQDLAKLVATWLGEDPENWPVLRLTLIDP